MAKLLLSVLTNSFGMICSTTSNSRKEHLRKCVKILVLHGQMPLTGNLQRLVNISRLICVYFRC